MTNNPNGTMHPRNILQDCNFWELQKSNLGLKKHLRKIRDDYCTINFKDPHALCELSKSLAKTFFHLDLEIPLNRLIPTLPLRLNYLLWIEDIISIESKNNVLGIDIGTGASAIYALIGAKYLGWKFLGTDTDYTCCENAQRNIHCNNLADKVVVKHVKQSDDKLTHLLQGDETQDYTFCMCNPPFFQNPEEVLGFSRSEDRSEPNSICTASPTEVITRGGEAGFVGDLIEESVALQTRVEWYTSMIGIKASLTPLLNLLQSRGVTRVAITEFQQGKTSRWGLAWTFLPSLPPLLTPNPDKASTVYTFDVPNSTRTRVSDLITTTAEKLKVTTQLCPKSSQRETWVWMTADSNTWSHGRRRKRRKLNSGQASSSPDQNIDKVEKEVLISDKPSQSIVPNQNAPCVPRGCLFHCFVSIASASDSRVSCDFRWILGTDKDALNQFVCYLARNTDQIKSRDT